MGEIGGMSPWLAIPLTIPPLFWLGVSLFYGTLSDLWNWEGLKGFLFLVIMGWCIALPAAAVIRYLAG